MDLIAKNKEDNDCVIVAAVNAIKFVGRKANYEEIRSKSIQEGWYDPEVGFHTENIEKLFEKFNISYREADEGSTTYTLRDKVKKGIPYIIICKPRNGEMGHAMFAVKGNRGVRVINANSSFRGWKTICKLLKEEKIWISAFEINQ